MSCHLEVIASEPVPNKDAIVLSNDVEKHLNNPDVDGVAFNMDNLGVLILSPNGKISSDRVLQIRKRMATPFTTPASFGVIETELGQQVTNGRFGLGAATQEEQNIFF